MGARSGQVGRKIDCDLSIASKHHACPAARLLRSSHQTKTRNKLSLARVGGWVGGCVVSPSDSKKQNRWLDDNKKIISRVQKRRIQAVENGASFYPTSQSRTFFFVFLTCGVGMIAVGWPPTGAVGMAGDGGPGTGAVGMAGGGGPPTGELGMVGAGVATGGTILPM